MGLSQDAFEDVNGKVGVDLNDGAGTALTSTLISAKQALDVNVANSISVGIADKTTYTYGTTTFLPVGGVFQDTSPTLTAGQSGAFRLTANRAVQVNLRDASGNELGAANASGVFVRPGDGTNTQAYSATNEAFVEIRQGGNVANVTAANELKVIDSNGTVPATGTLTQVAVTNASQTALASNANRKGMVFVNQGIDVIFLAFTATATTAAYTYKLQANSTLDFVGNRVYTGVVSVIGTTGGLSSLKVTELT